MRTRSEHREAVARRLELLHADPEPELLPAGAPRDEVPWWEQARVLELVPPVNDDPPQVPVPGRHADRRPAAARAWLAERTAEVVPDVLRHPGSRPVRRAGIGPWHLAVLAVVVAVGLALTCWWVMRGDATAAPVTTGTAAPLVQVSAPAPSPAAAAPASDAPSSSPSARSSPATVTVDVVGKVRRPRVVVLPAGSRVLDAIRAAGGARPRADLSGLNRARVLVDGEQVVVGQPPGAAAAASGSSGSSGSSGVAAEMAPAALVNLNTATVEELDTLPGVGPVTAQAIVDYRTEHGGFGSVDELLDVARIGEATLAKIAPHVTV